VLDEKINDFDIVERPQFKDRIHGVIIAADAKALTPTNLTRLQEMEMKFIKAELQPLIVLTKLDEVDSILTDRPDLVYESEPVDIAMKVLSSKTGISNLNIFPTISYTGPQTDESKCRVLDYLALKAVSTFLDSFIGAFLDNKYNQYLDTLPEEPIGLKMDSFTLVSPSSKRQSMDFSRSVDSTKEEVLLKPKERGKEPLTQQEKEPLTQQEKEPLYQKDIPHYSEVGPSNLNLKKVRIKYQRESLTVNIQPDYTIATLIEEALDYFNIEAEVTNYCVRLESDNSFIGSRRKAFDFIDQGTVLLLEQKSTPR
jgi:hypothetical protein